MKAYNLISSKGNKVANQIEIYSDDAVYFQSYNSIIVKKYNDGRIELDEYYWNYSKTTAKYRNYFLNEGINETRKKIASGIYKLVNLN